jgi:protein-S-isoprenylcysteine O-methyltransferase Ste14
VQSIPVKTRIGTALILLILPALAAVTIFTAAGRWDFPIIWALLLVLSIFSIAMATTSDPELIRERRSPGPGNRDRFTRPIGIVLILSHWIIGGLDIGRFHWSPIPRALQIAGVVVYAMALSVNLYALRVNRFYSSVVRIQTERQHHVIDRGPYRFVRHPGYAATILAMLSGGVALGSWLAMIPIVLFALTFLRRTLLEDKLLRRDLPGYADYAARVRHRLIPRLF